MYCPQCGQQQVTDDVRFCSRCGFQLEGVNSLLASGGVMPLTAMQGAEGRETPRRRGVRHGAMLMLFGIFLIPMILILSEIFKFEDELAMFGLLFFLGGFLRVIYAAIFEQGPFFQRKGQQQFVYTPAPNTLAAGTRGAAALPPSQATPARAYVPPARTDTAEISYRPSVTENTTRLLAEQEERDKRRTGE